VAEERYNMVVIGAGSAGLVTALIAAAVKAKVALIERDKMGGDCLNTGCVPSKALIKSSKVLAQLKKAEHYGLKGLKVDSAGLDFAAVMGRVQRVIADIAPHDSIERYQSLGVDCITGEAQIIDKHTVRVGDRTLKTKTIVIATGAGPIVPKIKGLDQVRSLTSENLWQLQERPKRLVVLGGGPIGCEMAQAFQNLGSQVTQVELGKRLMPREDDDAAAVVQQHLAASGVVVQCGATAVEVRLNGGQKELICQKDGRELVVGFDEILLAVGRRARTQGLDLEQLGLSLNNNGTLKVDEYLRANGDNIYACGDVCGPYQLTHAASHQAWYCAVNGLFSPFKKFKVDYRVLPWVTFTDPEVATVGLNETAAKERGVAYEVTKYGTDDLDRAIAEGEAYGFVKVLTVPGKDKILGVTIVSAHAGEMIAEYVTAMKFGLGLNKILGTIHAYPTFVEANKAVAGVWKRKHAPAGLLRWVERFHGWRR